MTCPTPKTNLNGCPRSLDESNFFPFVSVPVHIEDTCKYTHIYILAAFTDRKPRPKSRGYILSGMRDCTCIMNFDRIARFGLCFSIAGLGHLTINAQSAGSGVKEPSESSMHPRHQDLRMKTNRKISLIIISIQLNDLMNGQNRRYGKLPPLLYHFCTWLQVPIATFKEHRNQTKQVYVLNDWSVHYP